MNTQNNYIEEELTIDEFLKRFLEPKFGSIDNSVPCEIDIGDLNIEILGRNLKDGKDEFNRIDKFIIKSETTEHYTDGKLKGTGSHRIIENDKEIFLKDHPDFKKIDESIDVVDFDINKTHNYYANGRLNHNTISGGKALGYHCSVRLRLSKTGNLKVDKTVIGNTCKAVVTKNRMGPPMRKAEFEIYHNSGIADYSSWLTLMKEHNIINGAGTYISNSGEEFKFKSKDFIALMTNNSEIKEEVYDKICNAVIMKYKDPNSQIVEDATIENETDEVVASTEE